MPAPTFSYLTDVYFEFGAAGGHCSPTNPRPLDAVACRELYLSVL